MPRGAEDDSLLGYVWVGPLFIVGGNQFRYVDEVGGHRQLTCPGIDLHLATPSLCCRVSSGHRGVISRAACQLPAILHVV